MFSSKTKIYNMRYDFYVFLGFKSDSPAVVTFDIPPLLDADEFIEKYVWLLGYFIAAASAPCELNTYFMFSRTAGVRFTHKMYNIYSYIYVCTWLRCSAFFENFRYATSDPLSNGFYEGTISYYNVYYHHRHSCVVRKYSLRSASCTL